MRLIDADEIIARCNYVIEHGIIRAGAHAISAEVVLEVLKSTPTIVEYEGDINKVIVKGEEYHKQLATTWLNPYCPYKCKHCGHYSDSKTPYCAWCGRKAVNYESK